MEYKICLILVLFGLTEIYSQTLRLTGERKERDENNDLVSKGIFMSDGYLLPGEDLILECLVNDAKIGSYIQWKKQQLDGRVVDVARDAILDSPFNQYSRIQASYEPQGGQAVLGQLIIRSVGNEDSGKYICHYDTPNNGENIEEQMNIDVGQNFKVKMFATKVGSIFESEHELEDGQILRMSASEEWNVRCTFTKGNPEPFINMTLGEHDITDRYDKEHNVEILARDPATGEPTNTDAMNYIEHDYTFTTRRPLEVTYGSNRRNLTCGAYLPELEPFIVSVTPSLQFHPIITCEELTLTVDEMSPAQFECVVKADPFVEEVYWSWNTTFGEYERLYPGEHQGLYYAEEADSFVNDEHFHRLYIERAYSQTFREYSLSAKNAEGLNYEILTLKLGRKANSADRLISGMVGVLISAFLAIYTQF